MKYDFKCPGCGIVFEADVPFNAKEKKVPCTNCEDTAYRVFTPTPISYWGDGWTKQRDFSKG